MSVSLNSAIFIGFAFMVCLMGILILILEFLDYRRAKKADAEQKERTRVLLSHLLDRTRRPARRRKE